MTKAITLFTETSDIRKAIGSISKAGAKLDQMIQVAGLSVLAHLDKHGNITLACELYAGMPKGSRKLALAEWLLAHGKLSVNTDAGTKAALPFVYAKDKSTNMDGAMDKPWFEFKPEPDVDQAFDFQKMLTSLLNKAGKASQGGKEIVGADLLAKVRALTLDTPA